MNDYLVIKDQNEWKTILEKFTLKEKDIYFEYDYLNLYRKPCEEPVLVYMESDLGRIAYPFMLRDISYAKNLEDKLDRDVYFDISSPYGYGGLIVSPFKEDDRAKLIKMFYKKFSTFCEQQNIVSEFIRFCPLLENHKNMDEIIETLCLRKTVATNLQDYGDPLVNEVQGKKRRSANKCRKFDMEAVFKLAPKSFDKELDIYYETMQRIDAVDFYFFSREYFEQILTTLTDNVLVVDVMHEGKIIAFELCFIYGDIINCHLRGALKTELKCSPGDLSSIDVIAWGHENGYKYYFTGGGLTNDECDLLLRYKKDFSKSSDLNFYIGKKIWNKDLYDKFTDLAHNSQHNSEFFPSYRALNELS